MDAFSIWSICCFMFRCLTMWTPKNLTVSVIFSRCPYIVIEKLIRCVLPGFNLILHLSTVSVFGSGISTTLSWYYEYLALALKLLCRLRIARDLPVHQGLGISLTYRINKIGDRGLSCGTPWMGMIGSLSWSFIEIISVLWERKLLIHLINLLFRPIDVNLKRRPSNHTWSKACPASRNIPVVGWCSYFSWIRFVVYQTFCLPQPNC